jgi:hypothetical protein
MRLTTVNNGTETSELTRRRLYLEEQWHVDCSNATGSNWLVAGCYVICVQRQFIKKTRKLLAYYWNISDSISGEGMIIGILLCCSVMAAALRGFLSLILKYKNLKNWAVQDSNWAAVPRIILKRFQSLLNTFWGKWPLQRRQTVQMNKSSNKRGH